MNTTISTLMAGILLAAFVAVAPVQAETSLGQGDAVVRVVNYNKADVRVFVFDSEGRRTLLGVVRSGEFGELEIEEAITGPGPVQVKVYPVGRLAGLGAAAESDNGIKSSKLHLDGGDIVDFWVEPKLEDSMVRLTRG